MRPNHRLQPTADVAMSRARPKRQRETDLNDVWNPGSQVKKSKHPGGLPPEPTHYLNVDLDVYARTSLDGLVQALGEAVVVLYVGGGRRKHEAHVELASSHLGMSADETILGLIDVVRKLPRTHRKTWNSANRREFNIGIEAGFEPHGFELRLQDRTLRAIGDVGGSVVVTVYAPPLQEAKTARRRAKRR